MSHDGGVARWTTANAEEDLKAKEERHRDAKEKFEASKERRQGKKMMSDEKSKGLADTTAVEKAAVTSYGELITTKTKEVKALSKMIKEKPNCIGDVGVEIQRFEDRHWRHD